MVAVAQLGFKNVFLLLLIQQLTVILSAANSQS